MPGEKYVALLAKYPEQGVCSGMPVTTALTHMLGTAPNQSYVHRSLDMLIAEGTIVGGNVALWRNTACFNGIDHEELFVVPEQEKQLWVDATDTPRSGHDVYWCTEHSRPNTWCAFRIHYVTQFR